MIDLNQCCGCGNCSLVCPRNAIEMQLNDEGFWYPIINQAKCTNCNVCEQYCPVYYDNSMHSVGFGIKGYFGKHKKPDILQTCSSGGIATALSEYFIGVLGGVVYGSAYSDDYSCVNTIRIDEIGEIEKLKGSKYIQCLKREAFKNIKRDLENNRNVLYIALPCDIAALMQFLNKKYDSLYMVDLICHGPTSYFAYKDYLERKTKNKHLLSFSMRYKKDLKWMPYYLNIETDDNRNYIEEFWESDFGVIFSLFARSYCYNCKFKGSYRFSDLTIGDAWGAPKELISENLGGLSSIVVNTQKGLSLLKKCSTIQLIDTDVETIVKGNPNLVNKREQSEEWDYIAKRLKNNGLNNTIAGLTPLKTRVRKKLKYFLVSFFPKQMAKRDARRQLW